MDARKDQPYSSYEKFDFEVPTRTENDVYARYQVRIEEMRQSARIVKQALEGMPGGPWPADAPHVVLPDREKMKTQMEALIYHFKIVTEGFRVPEGEVYQVIESPRGEVGYYVVSDGTTQALSRARAQAQFRQSAGGAEDGGRHADRGRDRVDGQHGFRAWETWTDNAMTFSPELEAAFAKLLNSYPPGRQRSAVIPMLLYAQDEIGSCHRELIEEVARRVRRDPLQVDEVIGYYSMLHRKPLGKYHVQICTNISCLLLGGEELWEHACQKLGVGHKEVTADGQISLEEVECIGACSWAPAIQVNYDFTTS